MSAHVKVHGDVPRKAFDIPKMSDAHYWNDATNIEFANMIDNQVW